MVNPGPSSTSKGDGRRRGETPATDGRQGAADKGKQAAALSDGQVTQGGGPSGNLADMLAYFT